MHQYKKLSSTLLNLVWHVGGNRRKKTYDNNCVNK